MRSLIYAIIVMSVGKFLAEVVELHAAYLILYGYSMAMIAVYLIKKEVL